MCSVILDRLRSVAAARNVMPTPSAAARTLRFVSTMSFVPSPMLIAARPPGFSAACTRPSHASRQERRLRVIRSIGRGYTRRCEGSARSWVLALVALEPLLEGVGVMARLNGGQLDVLRKHRLAHHPRHGNGSARAIRSGVG